MASKLKLTELLYPTSTTPAITINADDTVTFGAPTTTITNLSTTNLAYTGTLTGGTGVVNLGSGQVYKDASGNVGIGTSSPSGKLDIVTSTTATVINSNNATNTGFVLKYASNLTSLGNNFGQPLAFLTNDTERARITSDGNLLVGATNQVTAGGVIRTVSKDGTWPLVVHDVFANTLAVAFVASNNAQVGSITVTTSATTYATSSDYRLKENIQPMTGALETVAQLNPVTYTWKADGSAGQGFIAHELQAVVPDCVTGAKDAVDAEGNPRYQGVDTSFLVATLVAAIQELKAEFDAYKLTHP